MQSYDCGASSNFSPLSCHHQIRISAYSLAGKPPGQIFQSPYPQTSPYYTSLKYSLIRVLVNLAKEKEPLLAPSFTTNHLQYSSLKTRNASLYSLLYPPIPSMVKSPVQIRSVIIYRYMRSDSVIVFQPIAEPVEYIS